MKRHMWLIVFVGLLAAGCGKSPDSSGKPVGGKPTPVKAIRVAAQSGEAPVQYSATVEPAEEATIAGKIMGKVDRVRVSEGDGVRSGQLLVELQAEDVQAKVAQTNAGVTEARVHFENARKNLERFEALFAEKAATQKELDDVRVAYESAEARLQAAQEMKREIEDLLRDVEVLAPFDGTVTKMFVDAGDFVTPGKPILTIENARQLEIVANVPESQIEHLSVGMPVRIIIPARTKADSTDQVFTGSIDQIVPSADPGSHQFEVKVFIQNPGGSVMSGMFARLVVSRALTESLMVPRESILRRGQLEGIFVVGEDGCAHLRWVRTGRVAAGSVEVLTGLDPGEIIVTQSSTRLKDGQRVEVTD